jgi:hypothetical protein
LLLLSRQAFEKDGLWQLRRVDYIDGVADLYVSKGSRLVLKFSGRSIFVGVIQKVSIN